MDSDEINSISDSVESQQVVAVIKTVYDDLISRGDLTANKTIFNLTASGDNTKPVLMTKPLTIDRIEWIKYNTIADGETDTTWAEMQYLPVSDFMDFIHMYSVSETNVDSFTHISDGFTFTFNYKNDTPPAYYTSFDGNTLIFDAYDSEVDTTLQGVKTICYGQKRTEFTEEDSFDFPALQPQQFSLLLNEAKSLAWVELKQTPHQKAEVTARRGWRHLQKTRKVSPDGSLFNSNAHTFDSLPNFSRK